MALFSKGKENKLGRPICESVQHVEPFTEELCETVESMKIGKSHSLDGIQPDAIKEVVKSQPEWLLI